MRRPSWKVCHRFRRSSILRYRYSPVILFTSVMSTIGTLQLFDEAMNITNGGPANSTLTLSMYIYNLSFKFVPNFGYAATVSYVIVFFAAVLALVQFKFVQDKNNDDL